MFRTKTLIFFYDLTVHVRVDVAIICCKMIIYCSPFLRIYLAHLRRTVWQSGSLPCVWKQTCTIRIHKKGEANISSSFRTIAVQSVSLEISTSCLRNAIYKFLSTYCYVEHKNQKCFPPNISGILEHTLHMAHIIIQSVVKGVTLSK